MPVVHLRIDWLIVKKVCWIRIANFILDFNQIFFLHFYSTTTTTCIYNIHKFSQNIPFNIYICLLHDILLPTKLQLLQFASQRHIYISEKVRSKLIWLADN